LRRLAIVIFSVLLAVAARAAEQKAPEGPVFVTLPAITIPVYEGERLARQASLVLALELEKGRVEADVAPLRPRLVDAYITDLTAIFEQRSFEDRLIEPQAIKPKLLETTERVLGPGLVKDVLIQQAMERARRR
jgi:flagellar FliL protein